MAHQLVTRVGDDLVGHVDALVAAGILESRSQAVRLGLERLVQQLERERIGREIVEGYTRLPQTEEELRWTDEAARRMIEEESW
jgi:Arc/MetJ-type ribon-helix-helix transcriptional regulator